MATPSSTDIHDGPTHLPGVTRSCFSRDGATIFTGGADALARIHAARDPTSEPGFFDEHREAITCMDCSPSRLLTGSADGKVRSFSYPENAFDGFVTSAGAVPIRWIAVDRAGERVVVVSDELIIKVVHLDDTTRTTLITASKPMRSASWHPTNGTLTLISTDGKIFIYELLDTGASCLKVIDGLVAPSKVENEPPPVAAWHPNGEYFVVPSKSQEIAIVDRDSWTKQGTFSTDGHDAEIGLLAWSPNGMYLVSSGKDDQVIVWETEGRKPLMRHKNINGTITSLGFSPTDNSITYTTISGHFITWSDPIPADHTHPAVALRRAPRVTALFDDDDEEGEDLAEFDDDWIVDDVAAEDGPRYGERERSVGFGAKEVVSITKAQPPFQPGSTPFKSKKRYLAFNMIGVIDVTDQDTHHVINVEFHDKSSRRGYHFQDHSKYSAAALGERGIVYAAAMDSGHPAVVHYRAYDAWASQSDWQINLPDGEDVLLVASGGGGGANDDDEASSSSSVAVATTKGYIRFFSGSGLQRYIWRMGEELVSMVAGKDSLFMVHREGGTSLDGCQNLRYTIIDLASFDVVQEGRLPLPKRTTLSWIGFAEYGAPMMYDSTGMLSLLDRYGRPAQARWIPLLDSNTLARKQGKDESYWAVGVTETQFMCVILKGSEREPTFPRPIILDLDMHMPLLNLEVTQGQLEERFVRGSIHVGLLRDSLTSHPHLALDISQREVELDKELLQLVQAACKADKLQRALDIVKLMHNPATVDAASKVAGFYHLPGLQEKIGLVREAVEDRSRHRPRPSATSRRDNDVAFAPRSNFSRRTGAARVSDVAVAETPEVEVEEMFPMDVSPQRSARKRERERTRETMSPEEEPPAKRIEPRVGPTLPSKNPFARRPAAAAGGNPFAKSGSALKSTSFFERVDNIEQEMKGKSKSKGKEKQTTLLGIVSTETVKSRRRKSTEGAEDGAQDGLEDGVEGGVPLEETQTDSMAIRSDRAGSELGEDEWPASDHEEATETEPVSISASA